MTLDGPGLDLARAVRRYNESAGRVVRATTVDEGEDLPHAVVGLLSARRSLEASLAVTGARDRTLGRLIDTLA
jgi:hypothetical protein